MGNAQCNGSPGSDSDISDNDSCPGLCDESYDSSDEETAPLDPENCSQTGGSETEDEDIAVSASASAAAYVPPKRTGDEMDMTPIVEQPPRKRRAVTHASKVECVDVQAIRTCLNTQKCGCSKNCMQKLKNYQERSVEAIEKIRLQRFSGKIYSPCARSHQSSSHPGV